MQGGDVYYDGPITGSEQIRAPRGTPTPSNTPSPRTAPAPRTESAGMFDEHLESLPAQVRPQPARPIPTGQQPPPFQMSGRNAQNLTPAQIAAAKQAKKRAAYEAAGIRSASYQQ